MTWDISNYSATPASNSAINGVNIAEGCNASGINDAIRQLMADIASYFTTSAKFLGSVLVGATTTSGSLANVQPVVAGVFQTVSGSASIPNGGSTVTISSIAIAGKYLVTWSLNEANGVGVFNGASTNLTPQCATICSGNYFTNAVTVTFQANAGDAAFGFVPADGGVCQFVCGNSTGSAQTLAYTFTRIA